MRKTEDMHYYLWEALCMEAYNLEELPARVNMDINFVNTAMRRTGVFSKPLRTMACWIEEDIEKFKRKQEPENEA